MSAKVQVTHPMEYSGGTGSVSVHVVTPDLPVRERPEELRDPRGGAASAAAQIEDDPAQPAAQVQIADRRQDLRAGVGDEARQRDVSDEIGRASCREKV